MHWLWKVLIHPIRRAYIEADRILILMLHVEAVKSGQVYYWRIDEVNTDGTISIGRVWSFTVATYIIVDDFEGYNDVDNMIYNTWADYYRE